MSSPPNVDAQRKQIVAKLTTMVERATIQSERYARTQRLVTGPTLTGGYLSPQEWA